MASFRARTARGRYIAAVEQVRLGQLSAAVLLASLKKCRGPRGDCHHGKPVFLLKNGLSRVRLNKPQRTGAARQTTEDIEVIGEDECEQLAARVQSKLFVNAAYVLFNGVFSQG